MPDLVGRRFDRGELNVNRRDWVTKAEARLGLGAWIEDRYNRRRRHSAIGMISPVRFEQLHAQAAEAARPRVRQMG